MKKFLRKNLRKKKLKEKWRKPKGRHSKMRLGKKARGKKPSTGFMKPRSTRGLIGGYRQVRVASLKVLEGLDPKKEKILIAKGVGKKKRLEILKKAKERKLKISNLRELTL
jgi:large subunit ribosomal protein L32e